MKKYSILIVLLLSLFLFPVLANADSGWDYDYGGGYDVGDYDTGSSYDSSSSGSYSTDRSSSSGVTSTVGTIVGIALVAVGGLMALRKKKGPVNKFMPEDNNATEESIIERGMSREHHETIEMLDNNYDSVIQKYLPDYTEEKLLKELFDIFVKVQIAWMNFDYDDLEKYCSKHLYESYRSDLESLDESHGKNILKEFVKINSNIRNIEERNHKLYVEVYLFASFYDYVVDTRNDKVLRGNMDAPVRNPYDLEFVLDLDGLMTCPSCGAPLTSDECDACHTLVEKKREEFVLNKKGIMRN